MTGGTMDEMVRVQLALLRSAFDGVRQGIIVVDQACVIRIANVEAERLLANTTSELVGLNIRDFLVGIDDANDQAHQLPERELTINRADGSTMLVEVTMGARARHGRENLRSISFREISRRKNALDRTMEEYVSTVSHELRTPLAAITGSLSVIRGGAVGSLPQKMVPIIEMAQRNAQRLTELVNDILDIEKIEAGHLELEMKPIDLNQVVRDALEAYQNYAIEKHLTLSCRATDQPTFVNGDPKRLEQVVANLFSNAAKFSEAGGTVDIAVETLGTFARVTVRDYGPGIPPNFQPRIFEKFARRNGDATRNRSGTGLGLSISKALIEAHSGSIEFSSRPGDTRFWFEMSLLRPNDSLVVPAAPGQS